MASIYQETMNIQHLLDNPEAPLDLRLESAQVALRIINERWDPSPKRVTRASCAFFIDDQLTTESFVNPSQMFGELALKGDVPRISCIDVDGRLTVALPFMDAVVLSPTQELEADLIDLELDGYNALLDGYDAVLPLGVPIQRPLYTPVESLAFIAFAA